MKKIKEYYIIPFTVAVLVAMVLIWLLFPETLYWKAAFATFTPLIILGVGFRIITYQRIKVIRSQLYQILQTLEEFDIDEPRKVNFESSPFPIFNELNEYLIELIDRVRSNYRANKQFTQNASHELQTPLAVIKGHVEILLQSPNIKEKEFESLAAVMQNTNRLSKLNSALILLSKIGHHRFVDSEQVSFTEVTEEVLNNFKDLIEIQEIEIRKSYKSDFKIEMSRTLVEIMIANLIQNAIRYNISKGYLQISTTSDSFSIANPGKDLNADPKALFKRFKRESDVEESLGLGLSIIKSICDEGGLSLDYVNQEGMHKITISSQD